MNIRLQAAIGLALIGLSTVAVTHNAQACGLPTDSSATAIRNPGPPIYAPSGRTASSTASINEWQRKVPITGLYYFTQTAEGNGPGGPPDGTLIDFGYQTWHADGTEFMNSGSRPPPSGNFCQGIWERTGQHTYALNHFALGWDNTGTVYIGPVNIREDVTLSNDNNSLSGDFSITQYAPDGSTVLGHVQGTVAATRRTQDSTN